MSADASRTFDRDRLCRVLRELREVLEQLPSDLRLQVAIRSAIAFIESALERGAGEERETQV